MKKTSSSKVEPNTTTSASFASTFVPTMCTEQQTLSTVFKTKAYSGADLSGPSILINLPKIKKEVKTGQLSEVSESNEEPEGPFRIRIGSQVQEGASSEKTGAVKGRDSLPALSKVKKEPVSTMDANAENEGTELGGGTRASNRFTPSEPQESAKSIVPVTKECQSEGISPASPDSHPSNRASPVNSAVSTSPPPDGTLVDGSKLPCKVPSRVYSKTRVTRSRAASEPHGPEIEEGNKSSISESALSLSCSSESSNKSNAEVNQSVVLNDEDNLMEMDEQGMF